MTARTSREAGRRGKKPLSGFRIINTRPIDRTDELPALLGKQGAVVIALPMIAIEPAEKGGALDRAIASLASYDWLVFTSANCARIFFDRARKIRGSARALAAIRIASIGPATAAAVRKFGCRVTVTAKDAVGEGLVESLQKAADWKRTRVLFPRAEKAREVVPEALASWGACVDIVTAYRTVAPGNPDRAVVSGIRAGTYDLIVFCSSSAFENFIQLTGADVIYKKSLRAASIGPATSAAMRLAGVEPLLEAGGHTAAGLADAIADYFSKNDRRIP
jgi:uroporphyrinogen III methyltransferase/synthase